MYSQQSIWCVISTPQNSSTNLTIFWDIMLYSSAGRHLCVQVRWHYLPEDCNIIDTHHHDNIWSCSVNTVLSPPHTRTFHRAAVERIHISSVCTFLVVWHLCDFFIHITQWQYVLLTFTRSIRLNSFFIVYIMKNLQGKTPKEIN